MIKKEMAEMKTIEKTLMAARLFDGFWDRWVAHGMILSEVSDARKILTTIDDWVKTFSHLGEKHGNEAFIQQEKGFKNEAEDSYRLAALYYNLVYWIYPNRSRDKIDWYKKSNNFVSKADRLSAVPCLKKTIVIDRNRFAGRIRIPNNPKGCIIIINPIDSSKEELYSYENHFVDSGFISVSFDGPGQGETFALNGLEITKDNWNLFVDKVIEYTASMFPKEPIYLFGTSSGAAWAIYGSANPRVDKVAAVSPPLENKFSIPKYFDDRINYIAKSPQYVLPNLINKDHCSSVILFHGNKDVMVADQDIYNFYKSIPSPKHLIEYPNEGHCCNFELYNVRNLSVKWFLSKGERDFDIT